MTSALEPESFRAFLCGGKRTLVATPKSDGGLGGFLRHAFLDAGGTVFDVDDTSLAVMPPPLRAEMMTLFGYPEFSGITENHCAGEVGTLVHLSSDTQGYTTWAEFPLNRQFSSPISLVRE